MPFEEKAALDVLIREIEEEMESLIDKIYPVADLDHRLVSLKKDLQVGKPVTNIRFDRIYPKMIRKLSTIHWSPVDVARRAADLLVSQDGSRVLDVGSGCGKFCLIGAASFPYGKFFGIEQRSYLNEIAKRSALSLNLSNVTFIDGNMAGLDWSEFDSFYFFNPFWENKMLPDSRIDISIPANQYRYELYLETVYLKLGQLKTGTRVVTYHGFGGTLPDSYEQHYEEKIGTSLLELWVKTK